MRFLIHLLRKFAEFYVRIFWKTRDDSRVIHWDVSEIPTYREYYPRQFYPRTIFISVVSVYTAIIFGLSLYVVYLGLIPSMDIREFHRQSVLTSTRIQQISDSLDVHMQYLTNLQNILSGNSDTMQSMSDEFPTISSNTDRVESQQTLDLNSTTMLRPMTWATPVESEFNASEDSQTDFLEPLQLPVRAPVQGIITQTLNVETGHFAVDIAAAEGVLVESIGDGFVILSDWTYAAGHTIAIQHANGYVSVYKHNQRLLKRIGDRVRTRENIAISGGSGEFSSGPHLHFELWNNGKALAPASYLLGY
ncbi:MAG: M23 family metallopeptidase [Bacteroidetes bacterium]|nr:M23 family metallopeptidase [Bacteroidota bacterium]MCY4233161.1 M23 family metallopeptidase [Bacteroidota bacterium]